MMFSMLMNKAFRFSAASEDISGHLGQHCQALVRAMLAESPENRPPISKVVEELKLIEVEYQEEMRKPFEPKVDVLFDLEKEAHRLLH